MTDTSTSPGRDVANQLATPVCAHCDGAPGECRCKVLSPRREPTTLPRRFTPEERHNRKERRLLTREVRRNIWRQLNRQLT